jgi:tagatose-6-phosphate ketose/aldose isomerase
MQVFSLVDCTVAKTAAICAAATKFIGHSEQIFMTLTNPTRPIDRVVYLGSNGLKGLASEAALKLLELSDGKIMATADSPLGFRHGPKTMINDSTLIVFFLSNNTYTRRYDLDLLHELRREKRAARIVALSSAAEDLPAHSDNIIFALPQTVHDLEQMPPFIVFAQLFALLSSLRLGITPDNPSVSGTVTRVVSGVTIHPLQGEALDVSGR